MSEDEEGNRASKELSPEQQAQIEEALGRARATIGQLSGRGLLGLLFGGLFRNFFRSFFRFPRIRGRKLAALGVGLLIMTLSVVTCSAGVNLTNLTSQYGSPVPASKEAASTLIQRTAVSLQDAAANRRLRITMSETEATSALSLGLLMPELMSTMETLPRERLQATDDIGELRSILRQHRKARDGERNLRQKLAALLDPDLRTGDVQVKFTGSGEIVMAGYVQAWRWKQPALVVFAPRASSGELELNFISGRLGRLPAPSWAFNKLGALTASLILQGRDYAEISNITVSDGHLTFEAAMTR